ncbi:hypothetical protein [Escherichia coli]|uniref:hypothetical protein n=1 Tax=Escherichia coli TaxID=562 RepID=UPI000D0BC717|nr:hypothetical protein [Escherichia coli]EFO9020209.1 hypothetical protein [Escherichia coli]EHC1872387.1 hypothetical protein [Escherichia coli]EHI1039051.1 hypothetical protein [Escherichia coli]EKS2307716.1 hypothetical protein [Escherichia coli]MDZ9727916.1 hypothetical protein [Escherichia coli]
MDSVHYIWCPLFSQEFQDLPDGAETTLTENLKRKSEKELAEWVIERQTENEPLTYLMDQYVLLAYRTTVDTAHY